MVNKITTPPTTSELITTVNEIIDDKQDAISDLATIRSGAAKGATSVQSYNATNPALTVTGGICTWSVTHNLNNTNVGVFLYEVSSGERVMYDYSVTNANSIAVKILSSSNISAGTYKVVVHA